VAKAIDQEQDNIPVAIKIIRMFDIMRESGEKEKEIVKRLNAADRSDRRHIVRLFTHFEYNMHLCLVYECLEMNLREALKKLGKGNGLSLRGVQLYSKQLFTALALLHKLKLVHTDLKPDNIMVTADAQKIKLCDFGSCITLEELGITEYLVSRFYRAPEIMLGCKLDCGIDVWAAGCSLLEAYTGKVTFPGGSNNEMLKLIMQTKGRIKKKMLRSGIFVFKHFNPAFQFLSVEADLLNKGSQYTRVVPMPTEPTNPVMSQLE